MARTRKTAVKKEKAIEKNQTKKIYISKKAVHLGTLKRTIKAGTYITYIQEDGKEYIEIAGERTDNLTDFNICLKHNFFEETNKTEEPVIKEKEEKKEEKKTETFKMPINKSDEDLMEEAIDIAYTKNDYMKKEKAEKEGKVSEEKSEDIVREVRGLKVLAEKEQAIISDGVKIEVSTKKTSSSDSDIAKEINGETEVVTSLNTEEKVATTSKRKPNPNAAKRAAARKKESENNQKKLAEEKKKR